ncbi:MAG TPA: hypothetical protein VI197_19020 [Polyangiaceae bacterium]
MATISALEAKVGHPRYVRDPIHGDIELSPLEAAVVDSRQFQRLRYIRQNGLLHFIFPGAVHTRFAHSLGAFALSKRAFAQLVSPLVPVHEGELQDQLEYLGTVFRLAALLHDVGHCAFSHSIEHVEIEGKPFFGTLETFLTQMGQVDLLEDLRSSAADVEIGKLPTKHEHISLVLVRRIFENSSVRKRTSASEDLARDIAALIDGTLKPSERFAAAAQSFATGLQTHAAIDFVMSDSLPSQILSVLHALISGTVDVDRLDYLVRDSLHCGVPYGKCEVEFLLKSIRIGAVAGLPALILDNKARYALEDMLWSRYQLFVQVLNHKTNVALNSALRVALEEAVEDVRIEMPDTEPKLLAFTDDYVMSKIHRVAMAGKLSERSYTKALIDRRFPLHLDVLELVKIPVEDRERAVSERVRQLASELGVAETVVTIGRATSKIIKENPLYLQSWNRRKQKYEEPVPFEYSSIQGPLEHVVVHFFADRDTLPGHQRSDAS